MPAPPGKDAEAAPPARLGALRAAEAVAISGSNGIAEGVSLFGCNHPAGVCLGVGRISLGPRGLFDTPHPQAGGRGAPGAISALRAPRRRRACTSNRRLAG